MNRGNEKKKLVEVFLKEVNPYKNLPPLHLDLRRMSQYAEDEKKAVTELSEEEKELFRI